MAWIKPAIFSLLAAVGALFLILGAPPAGADLPRGYVTVEYWEKWTGDEAAQMLKIVNDFNQTVGREKKIHVHYMSMSSIDQKTLIATSAGVPPDIAGLWDHQLAQYASMGAIQPLDKMAEAHGITAKSYLPVFWNACHYEGHLYGLVSTPGTIALVYNKQLFHAAASKLRAAGLDPDQPPRTIAEFDKYAAALDTRDAAGEIDCAGFLPLQSWYVPEMSYWFGGHIFDPKTHEFMLDSPPMIRAYKWIQSYSHRLGHRAMMDFQNTFGNFDSPDNPFLVDKLAMLQQGPWMAFYIKRLRPSMNQVLVPRNQESTLPHRDDNYAWGVAAFPSAVPGLDNVSFNSFDVMVIPTGALHPEAAFDFIAYVNRQDVSEKLCSSQCKNCQLAHVSEDFIENHPNPYIKVFQKLAASPHAYAVPSVPIWPEAVKTLVDAAQSVALEGNDPTKVLANAQKRLQAQYDRFRRIEVRREELGLN